MTSQEGYANLPIPEWLYGHNPDGFMRMAELHGVETDHRMWSVCTNERYLHRQAAGLIKSFSIAGPSDDQAHWSQLPKNGFMSVQGGAFIRFLPSSKSHHLLDVVNRGWFNVTTAADENQRRREAMALLTTIRNIPSEDGNLSFENASLHFVYRAEAILARLKLIQVLILYTKQPQFDPFAVGSSQYDKLLFQSSGDLMTGGYFLDSYLAPLLGALSPYVWAFSIPAPKNGALFISLGAPPVGRSSFPPTLLDTISVRSPAAAVPKPDVGDDSMRAAIGWWVDRLDQLFAIVTDFSLFTNNTGAYDASAHLNTILSVEQLFRRVASAILGYSDAEAAKVLLFSSTDMLNTIMGWQNNVLFSMTRVDRIVENLDDRIPGPAKGLLLPGARRGAAALRAVSGGFYLTDVNGQVPDKNGHSMSRERAVEEYLTTLRNSVHGFGANTQTRREKEANLLARHDGKFPPDLPMLGYLHLLNFLSNLPLFRQRLESQN